MFHELQIAQQAGAANSRIIGETVAKRLIFRSPTNGAACNILTPLTMLVVTCLKPQTAHVRIV
jgi:hypothetical protein